MLITPLFVRSRCLRTTRSAGQRIKVVTSSTTPRSNLFFFLDFLHDVSFKTDRFSSICQYCRNFVTRVVRKTIIAASIKIGVKRAFDHCRTIKIIYSRFNGYFTRIVIVAVGSQVVPGRYLHAVMTTRNST